MDPTLMLMTTVNKKHSGAIVEVIWPRDTIDAKHGQNAVPIGLNQQVTLKPGGDIAPTDRLVNERLTK